MMNIGDKKSKIVVDIIKTFEPKTIIELGAYVGYSAIQFAQWLPDNGNYYSFEIDPLYAAISTKIIEYAGLKHKVTVIIGSFEKKYYKILPLKDEIDMIFIDHAKNKYLSDLKLIESAGLLKKGTVIVADNIGYPGAPDYLEYVLNNSKYQTTIIDTTVEYSNVADKIALSIVL